MAKASLRTDICDLFGIEHPIVLAGMGGVAMAELTAAVSNAGGLGVLGAATLDPDAMREEIRRTRELTDKPFAVDLLAAIPRYFQKQLAVLFEEKIAIFVAGLAVPEEFIGQMHESGMKVVVMTGKVRHAVKAERAGADVVAAQGTEAGGHTGEIGGMALLPQVVDAVSIPVLGAGGIVDGRGVAAALALGASGAIIGTRFIATREATAAPSYQQCIVESSEDATVRTRCYTGKPARTIKNPYNAEWASRPNEIQPFPAQLIESTKLGLLDYMGLSGDIDPNRSFMPAGQGLGLIHDVEPAAVVLHRVVEETIATLSDLAQRTGVGTCR